MPRWEHASDRRLLDGTLALARTRPIHEVSVAAVCSRSGVTRDTFYRYASRPIDLLARALAEDLPSAEALLRLRSPVGNPMLAPGRAVLEHVHRQRAAYRNALHPHLDAALRDLLVGRIEGLLAGFLDDRPGTVRFIDDTPPSPAEQRLVVVFTASGIVGAIERWVDQDDPEPVDRLLVLLFTAAAPWWREPLPVAPGPERSGRPADQDAG